MTQEVDPHTRPRRGPPRKDEPGAREKILAVAKDLFYGEGIRATGVDTIVARSGVSKTSFYRVFPSKDDLIAEYARQYDRLYWTRWDNQMAPLAGEPRKQLFAFIDSVASRVMENSFRGCPCINIASEIPDAQHPARRVAAEHKMELKRRLQAIAQDLSVPDPGLSAEQLVAIANGAYSTAVIARELISAESLRSAAAAAVAAA
ncbi:TetR/AcrR family transcriptional regulator [Rhizobium sp. BK251]|uniref:TetR/AcrR family transcriptional regulator n=1 Tax=Rhizobium sp. BK251 TaxID=2512125 RepID=UPI0010454830|nr:TetR/AcrR family transcriptional regulator [Rhizobium sp. BK251]TCL71247.1 TetR family transcriptional regulator [Rhizobium sp. BK251]